MYMQMIQENHPNQQTNRQPNKNTNINTDQPEQYRYQRKYPKFSSVRLSHRNIAAIKSYATRYNQTIDDIVTILLGQLDYYNRIGYPEATKDERSF